MSTVGVTALSREQLILNQLPQVSLMATRIHRRCPSGVALEDLVSAGTTGLIQGVDRYDANRNLKLKTFAKHRIQGAILDYLRQLDPLPRRVRQFQRKRDAICRDLEQSLNRVPSTTQIADAMGISSCTYQQLDREAHAGSPVSLERSIAEIGSKAITLPDPGAAIDRAERKQRVCEAIQSLPAIEQRVLNAVLQANSLHQIAGELRMSQSRVSQLKNSAIARLRRVLRACSVQGSPVSRQAT